MGEPQRPGPLDVAASLCVTAMVVLLVASGHGIAPGWLGWALGVMLALGVLGLWVQWMAADSPRRLPNPTRFVVQVVLFLVVAAYATAGGLAVWGLALAAAAIVVFGLHLRRPEPEAQSSSGRVSR